MSNDLKQYGQLLSRIKDRIRHAQIKATLSANAEMILMYWDIGRMIHERQRIPTGLHKCTTSRGTTFPG